eukprot:TRINITY_DN11853_c0_g1_i1.p1 TRINITY_DN11853_c0_g1~~TRINITY_DN11853_c0_g1_i1.p1  ORF type:complete len:456 (+),score=119.69 TRINITY_DN11853_c0_g1_i1:66-1370(+)
MRGPAALIAAAAAAAAAAESSGDGSSSSKELLGGLVPVRYAWSLCSFFEPPPDGCEQCLSKSNGLQTNSSCGSCLHGGGDCADCLDTLRTINDCSSCAQGLPSGALESWAMARGCLANLPLPEPCGGCAAALPDLSQQCAVCLDGGLQSELDCNACLKQLKQKLAGSPCAACAEAVWGILDEGKEQVSVSGFELTRRGVNALWAGFAGLAAPSVLLWWSAHGCDGGAGGVLDVFAHSVATLGCLAYLVMAASCPPEGGFAAEAAGVPLLRLLRCACLLVTLPLQLRVMCDLSGAGEDTFVFLAASAALLSVSLGLGCMAAPGWHRWLFGGFGVLLVLPMVHQLAAVMMHVDQHRRQQGYGAVSRCGSSGVYPGAAVLMVITLLLYPVAWLLAEGIGVFDYDTEVIVYAGLDVVSKGLFSVYVSCSRAKAHAGWG